MRAITDRQTGAPDVLTLTDKPAREPGPGEVRVRMHRSGVNPEVAIVPVRHVVTLPDNGPSISERASACRSSRRTDASRLPRTDRPGWDRARYPDVSFLIAGGAGAVGNAAVQLARWSDATVISTVSSPEKARLSAAAGSDHVLDYQHDDVIAEIRGIAPHGVRSIVEVSPAANAELDVAVLAPNGSVAVYADNGGEKFTLPVRALIIPNARRQFVLLYTAPAAAKARAVEDVSEAVIAVTD